MSNPEFINTEVTKRSPKEPVCVFLAWPYVNGQITPGHLAGYLFPGDFTARYFRVTNHPVLMVSGSDCHGTPVTMQAEKEGLSPIDIANLYHDIDKKLLTETLGLSYDLYTRTDTENHAAVVQDMFIQLANAGLITTQRTSQYYSETSQKYLPDRYVSGTCPHCSNPNARGDQCDQCTNLIDTGTLIEPRYVNPHRDEEPVSLKDTEHYYLDLTPISKQLREFIEIRSPAWRDWIGEEVTSFMSKVGLQPRPITRDMDYGITIPVDRLPASVPRIDVTNKRFYVWFEAVIGYLSASKLWADENNQDVNMFWTNPEAKHYYFMGVDNLQFHALFWPGQLIGANPDLHLPDVLVVQRFLEYADGSIRSKFSKSRGITVDVEKLVKRVGNSPLRAYVLSITPETASSAFNLYTLVEYNNGVLVKNPGNYVHRTLSINKDQSALPAETLDPDVAAKLEETFTICRKAAESGSCRQYLQAVLELSAYGNKMFSMQEVWKLKKDPDNKSLYNHAIYQHYAIIETLSYLYYPLLPEIAQNITTMLGHSGHAKWPEPGQEITAIESNLACVIVTKEPTPLFRNILPAEVEDLKPILK